MPLLRVDVIEGRSQAEVRELLDAIHCAMLAAFKVPERDRYQIVHEHPAAEMIIQDTGLGIPRTETGCHGASDDPTAKPARNYFGAVG